MLTLTPFGNSFFFLVYFLILILFLVFICCNYICLTFNVISKPYPQSVIFFLNLLIYFILFYLVSCKNDPSCKIVFVHIRPDLIIQTPFIFNIGPC